MRLTELYRGIKYTISVIVLDDGSSPARDFLEKLKVENPASYRSLVNVLTMHADIGQLINKEKSRPLKGDRYRGLFEFKSKQGARTPYFYSPGRMTILTHGFLKGAPVKAEFKKAKRIRDQYNREVEDGRT